MISSNYRRRSLSFLWFLANHSPDRYHTWRVFCWGPNKRNGRVWRCLDERYTKKLQEAIPDSNQSTCSEHCTTNLNSGRYRIVTPLENSSRLSVTHIAEYSLSFINHLTFTEMQHCGCRADWKLFYWSLTKGTPINIVT